MRPKNNNAGEKSIRNTLDKNYACMKFSSTHLQQVPAHHANAIHWPFHVQWSHEYDAGFPGVEETIHGMVAHHYGQRPSAHIHHSELQPNIQ